ncbi:MAG: hypothetical protein NT113_01685, partial [Hyphomicrobiales bacterium]|nr:hypothetical protein [Hyphomicrobiales bacterium]
MSGRGGRLAVTLALVLTHVTPMPASAQFLGDRPAPVPPANIPDVPSGPAISLAPPSGPAAAPALPAPLLQPPAANVPPPAPLPVQINPAAPAQGALALSARYGKELPAINGGLVWRVYSDRPDETGAFKLLREDRSASPNIPLPAGSYVVHVALGLVSAVRPVTIKSDVDRESFL